MSIFSLESESGLDLAFPPLSDDSKQMFITAYFVTADLKSRLLPDRDDHLGFLFESKNLQACLYVWLCLYGRKIIANAIKLNY